MGQNKREEMPTEARYSQKLGITFLQNMQDDRIQWFRRVLPV